MTDQPTLFKTRRRPRPKVDPKIQYRILKRIAQACVAKNVPPLDERLKSIVAGQVGNLLRGGWPETEITHVAVELALTYDRFHQHESMLALQRVMEIADEERQEKAHETFEKEEAKPMNRRVAKILGAAVKRDPRRLPANHRPEGDPCSICQGPPGVHVSFTSIPDLEREAMEQLERNRGMRRPMRAIGE